MNGNLHTVYDFMGSVNVQTSQNHVIFSAKKSHQKTHCINALDAEETSLSDVTYYDTLLSCTTGQIQGGKNV